MPTTSLLFFAPNTVVSGGLVQVHIPNVELMDVAELLCVFLPIHTILDLIFKACHADLFIGFQPLVINFFDIRNNFIDFLPFLNNFIQDMLDVLATLLMLIDDLLDISVLLVRIDFL